VILGEKIMEKFSFAHCFKCKKSITPNRPIRYTIECPYPNNTILHNGESDCEPMVFCYFCYKKNEAEILSLDFFHLK